MVSEPKKKQKLDVPSTRSKPKDDGIKYTIETYQYKLVSDYSKMSFADVKELSVFEFWQLLRDSVIYQAEQTEDGQDWLKQCWVSEQTEPDRETLRKFFK